MLSTLDVLRHQMQDAEPVLKALYVELEGIEFDPQSPPSVEAAIRKVELIIDAHLAEFKANPILGPMAEALKSQYIEGIQEQVSGEQANDDDDAEWQRNLAV